MRQLKTSSDKPRLRLRCDQWFASRGAHNRRCKACQHILDMRAQKPLQDQERVDGGYVYV